MIFEEYYSRINHSFKFPTHVVPDFTYLTLGVAGEIGELIEKLDTSKYVDATDLPDFEKLIKKEIGDVLWYLTVLRYTFQDVKIKEDIASFQSTCFLTLKESLTTFLLHFQNTSLKMCEAVKKQLRDYNGELELNGFRTKMLGYIHRLTEDLAILCNLYGLSLEEIAEDNIIKLLDRADRDVIHGEGDLR